MNQLYRGLIFAVVARAGSLREAAEELGVSVATVSELMKRFQAEVGIKLLDRRGKRKAVVLTPLGAEFLKHTEAMAQANGEWLKFIARIKRDGPDALLGLPISNLQRDELRVTT